MSRGLADLPVLVVANKMDLLSQPDTSDRGKLRQDIANKVRRSSCIEGRRGVREVVAG